MSLMGYAVFVILVLLMILRVPLAFCMSIPALAYLLVNNLPIDIMAIRMTYAVDSFPLLAVPLFLLAGNLMNSSGITDRIFNFSKQLVGHIPGGLAHVNVLASLIFSGCSGSALADVGGLGSMEMKAMTDAGYKKDFSAAVTIASSTIGPIFPPSVPLIIFGAVTETSAVNLLIAGISPGIVVAIFLMITIAIIAKIRKFHRDLEIFSLKNIFLGFIKAFPPLMTPVILIFGMISGIFSPTEAAGVTVLYALILGFMYKEISVKQIYNTTKETVISTATIMFLVASALLFGWIITVEQVPQVVGSMMHSISTNPLVVMLVVNILLLIVGCFLETVAAILLFAPLVTDILVEVGYDPVQIGMVFVFNLMIGLITPPVGMSLYLVSKVADVRVENVIREVLPFFIPLIVVLFLISYVPQFTMYLPRLMQ